MSDVADGGVLCSGFLRRGMSLALQQARFAKDSGNVPVGAALLTPDGSVLASAHNDRSRVLGHAEVMILLRLCGPYAPDEATLFVTLEPCPMCAGAIVYARVSRLVFGAYDVRGGAVEHGPCLLRGTRTRVIGGVQEALCASMIRDFFTERRRDQNVSS